MSHFSKPNAAKSATTPKDRAACGACGYTDMTTSNNTTPTATTTAPTAPVTGKEAIEKNGLKFSLLRDETKGKGDKEGTSFWNVPSSAVLAGLTADEKKLIANDETPAEQTKPVWDKCLNAYVTLLGADKVVEYVSARLDVAMRNAQLEAGKDNWTMEVKLDKALDYVLKSDFGRNRSGGIAGLTNKLEAAQKLTKIQGDIIRVMQAMMTETDAAKKLALQQEMLGLMSAQAALSNPTA